MITTGLMSSDSAEHFTPPDFLSLVEQVAPIELDPCWSPKAFVRPGQFCSDGLKDEWRSAGLIFVNPPYGRSIGEWTSRCAKAAHGGASVLALLPARTDAAWFQLAVATADATCFLRGRLSFWTTGFCATCMKVGKCAPKKGHKGIELDAPLENSSAPFPSVVLFWGQSLEARFRHIFKNMGWMP